MAHKLTLRLRARIEHTIGWIIWKIFVAPEVTKATKVQASLRINNKHH